MKYFLDTEFSEASDPVSLISVGVVADDGREFYWISDKYASPPSRKQKSSAFAEYQKDALHPRYFYINDCNDWVKKNVLPDTVLLAETHVIGDSNLLKTGLTAFTEYDSSVQFWGYYSAYDWFLLASQFKGFDNLPKKWSQTCYDVHQLARTYGIHRELPKKLEPVHNAVVDARWTKQAFERVIYIRDNQLPPGTKVWP